MWLLATLPACLLDPDAWEARRRAIACASAFTDADADAAYVAGPGAARCRAPGPIDCDDADAAVAPDATETPADGIDSDCDGVELCFVDGDADGSGGARVLPSLPGDPRCEGAGFSAWSSDCDDTDGDVAPGREERLCDGVDEDCDPTTPDLLDEVPGDGVDQDCDGEELCFEDLDDDGFGSDVIVPGDGLSCRGAFVAAVGGDCGERDAGSFPGAPERCNHVDDDCDGLVDDDDPDIDPAELVTVVADGDGDGFGHPTDSVLGCFGPPDDNRLDCDDTDPLATVVQDWFADADGDGAGDGAAQARRCSPPRGLAPEANGVDCAPDDPLVFPLQTEDCVDDADQDCDNLVDCDDPDCGTDPTCVPPCAEMYWSPTVFPASTSGTSLGAGDGGTGTCGFIPSEDVAIWFVPTVSGTIVFDTSGSGRDTVLWVLDGCGGAELACNDDEPLRYRLWSAVQVSVTEGVPILIVVDGYDNLSIGPFQLQATLR